MYTSLNGLFNFRLIFFRIVEVIEVLERPRKVRTLDQIQSAVTILLWIFPIIYGNITIG